MQEPCVCECECGETAELNDMTKCQHCEETKCVDCFTMDEDSEACDSCAENLYFNELAKGKDTDG